MSLIKRRQRARCTNTLRHLVRFPKQLTDNGTQVYHSREDGSEMPQIQFMAQWDILSPALFFFFLTFIPELSQRR